MRHKGESFEWHVELENKVATAHVALSHLLATSQFPQRSREFLDLIIAGHGRLFEAEPEIAGRFRLASDEDIQFGSRGYTWYGDPPEMVESRLSELWTLVVHQLEGVHDKRGAAEAVAFFLERFFMIHPFVDGNGRVGRAIAGKIVRKCGPFDFGPKAMRLNARHRREYSEALNYAHARTARLSAENPDSVDDSREELRLRRPVFDSRHDYLKFLVIVIDGWIVDVLSDTNLVEEDPNASDNQVTSQNDLNVQDFPDGTLFGIHAKVDE